MDGEKSVKVILRDSNGKYLLQFRDGAPGVPFPLQWCLYGGACEENEAACNTAIRELKEELSMDFSCDQFEELGRHIINGFDVTLLRCKTPLLHTSLPVDEGAGVGFFAEEELMRIPLTEDASYLLEKYVLKAN